MANNVARRPWILDTVDATDITTVTWKGRVVWEIDEGLNTDSAILHDKDGRVIVQFFHDGNEDRYEQVVELTRGLRLPTLSAGRIVIHIP